MKPIVPPLVPEGYTRIVYKSPDPNVVDLPGCVDARPGPTYGTVMTEWELSAEELAAALDGGRVRLWIWTFGQKLQPVAVEIVEHTGEDVRRETP